MRFKDYNEFKNWLKTANISSAECWINNGTLSFVTISIDRDIMITKRTFDDNKTETISYLVYLTNFPRSFEFGSLKECFEWCKNLENYETEEMEISQVA